MVTFRKNKNLVRIVAIKQESCIFEEQKALAARSITKKGMVG